MKSKKNKPKTIQSKSNNILKGGETELSNTKSIIEHGIRMRWYLCF